MNMGGLLVVDGEAQLADVAVLAELFEGGSVVSFRTQVTWLTAAQGAHVDSLRVGIGRLTEPVTPAGRSRGTKVCEERGATDLEAARPPGWRTGAPATSWIRGTGRPAGKFFGPLVHGSSR